MRFVKEYRVLDVDLGAGGASQCVLLKEHSDRASGASAGARPGAGAKDRTLFVGNIDYGRKLETDEVEAFIADLFSSFGDVESVALSQFKKEVGTTRNTRFAHVVFDKKKAVKLALQATDQMYADINHNIIENWGLEVVNKDFSSNSILDMFMLRDEDPAELQEEVDAIMADFELGEKAAREERERRLQEADADGFMMVKHRKKRKRVEATARRGSGGPRSRKKKTYELKNFYSHQKREEKREKLYELRQKFEEDKEKVAAMKEARKFKPF
jgi:hypothetical protein